MTKHDLLATQRPRPYTLAAIKLRIYRTYAKAWSRILGPRPRRNMGTITWPKEIGK